MTCEASLRVSLKPVALDKGDMYDVDNLPNVSFILIYSVEATGAHITSFFSGQRGGFWCVAFKWEV